MFDEEYGFDTAPYREPTLAVKIIGWTIVTMCGVGIVVAAVLAVPVLLRW